MASTEPPRQTPHSANAPGTPRATRWRTASTSASRRVAPVMVAGSARSTIARSAGSAKSSGSGAGIAAILADRSITLRPVGERSERPVRVEQAGEIRLARVESLRALAALAVVVGHLWILTRTGADALVGNYWRRLLYGGGFGVFVFFALSGYLLFWPFVRSLWGDGGPISLGRYALNRALRILPLYYVAIVVLLVLQNHGGTFEQWWRHALFVQAMWTDSLNAVDGSLWSVSVEIQFYVLLPLIAAALAWASRRSRAGAAVILLAAAAASYALRRHLAGR